MLAVNSSCGLYYARAACIVLHISQCCFDKNTNLSVRRAGRVKFKALCQRQMHFFVRFFVENIKDITNEVT
jgi:hypothetical protein